MIERINLLLCKKKKKAEEKEIPTTNELLPEKLGSDKLKEIENKLERSTAKKRQMIRSKKWPHHRWHIFLFENL